MWLWGLLRAYWENLAPLPQALTAYMIVGVLIITSIMVPNAKYKQNKFVASHYRFGTRCRRLAACCHEGLSERGTSIGCATSSRPGDRYKTNWRKVMYYLAVQHPTLLQSCSKIVPEATLQAARLRVYTMFRTTSEGEVPRGGLTQVLHSWHSPSIDPTLLKLAT